MYRSVIFSYPEKKILSFTPVKSIPSSTFMQKYPTIKDNIFINEYIEGVMIQLFYDFRVNCWTIATKGNIGCKYGFYNKNQNVCQNPHQNQNTFYNMFLDALHANKNESLNQLAIII